MEFYPIPLVPGPMRVPQAVLDATARDYGSGDLEQEFAEVYARTEQQLAEIVATRNRVAIMTGEGMVALWAGLNSVLRPGDRVVAISTGLFGEGIGEMAAALGADVRTVHNPWNEVVDDLAPLRAALAAHRPKVVTMVHCETPSGTLNPAGAVAGLLAEFDRPLFYVDAVASAGGAPVLTDEWGVDLLLLGSQKAFSAPPLFGMAAVSERAWTTIEAVNYQGYDALLPWRDAHAAGEFPYTPAWGALAGLEVATRLLLEEGLVEVFARHKRAAALCRARLRGLGIELFPTDENTAAPTVTAAWVPEAWTWAALDRALRARGVVVGGTWGRYAGRLFRIGHMGTQADEDLLNAGLDILAEVLAAAPER